MKESISYSFLLNIVIVFIFVCFAIIMGVLSYYRAFRANEAIVESIEKYEGFNCASQAEIDRKLGTIGYVTPFSVTCDDKDQPCKTDTNENYKILSYNLDGPSIEEEEAVYAAGDNMSSISITNEGTKHYQYGVYTYMYVDLPVVSNMIRIPFYSKTNVMYEFRDLDIYVGTKVYDTRLIPKDDNGNNMNFLKISTQILSDYVESSVGKASYFQNINSEGYDARKRAQYDVNGDGIIDTRDSGIISGGYDNLYGIYGTCDNIKTFENY